MATVDYDCRHVLVPLLPHRTHWNDRMHEIPRAADIHDAVDDQRRRLEPAVGAEVEVPGEAERFDGVDVDLRQRAEALLGIRAAVREPVVGLGVGGGRLGRRRAGPQEKD